MRSLWSVYQFSIFPTALQSNQPDVTGINIRSCCHCQKHSPGIRCERYIPDNKQHTKSVRQSGRRSLCSPLPHHRTCGSAYGGSMQLQRNYTIFAIPSKHGRSQNLSPVYGVAVSFSNRIYATFPSIYPIPGNILQSILSHSVLSSLK